MKFILTPINRGNSKLAMRILLKRSFPDDDYYFTMYTLDPTIKMSDKRTRRYKYFARAYPEIAKCKTYSTLQLGHINSTENMLVCNRLTDVRINKLYTPLTYSIIYKKLPKNILKNRLKICTKRINKYTKENIKL